MNSFTVSSISVLTTSIIIGGVVFLRGQNRLLAKIWTSFCLAICIWGVGGIGISLADDKDAATLWWRISCVGIFLIPVFYYHLVHALTNSKRLSFLRIIYTSAFCVIFYNAVSKEFIGDLQIVFNQFYWPYWWSQRNLVFLFSLIFFYGFVLLFAFFQLFYTFLKSNGIERNKYKYFIIGSLVGWIGGETNFFPTFGCYLYPHFNLFIALCAFIIAFAIVKHRLMDITIVITRTTIFIIVYSLILGIPFLVAFGAQPWLKLYLGEMWWMTPLILLTVLATAGPFIYLYIQKRAEDKLFQDQKRYQATLRQAATGMGRIKDLRKLVAMIVHIVTRSVRVEHSAVYLKGSDDDNYTVQGYRSRKTGFDLPKVVPIKSTLIKTFNRNHNVLVYSELRQRLADIPSDKLKELVSQMEELKAELIIPSFVDDKLIAFLVMGQKVSGELYSDDDITVFSILSSQAALAIENCQFYLEMRATHEQLFQAEKMATIGIMADGLSHQINNRLHALGFIAGDALDTVQMKKDVEMSDEIKEVFVDLEHALNRIQENVTQGGEIVQGLLKYTRKAEEGFGEVELDILVDEALKMAQFKIKTGEMQVIREFPPGLPQIHGNFTQLQEVFFNLIDNAYDAMMQRRSEKKEEGYQPKIIIRAEARGRSRINITLSDNGIGIKQEDQKKIFTPFFTTKLSSKKGTGLGLYVIQKLIEENHKGKVIYRSQYMKGTQVYVTLPTSEG